MRIKVQLLLLFALRRSSRVAAPAGAAEYTVVTCTGQAAAAGGWALFASGPNTALVGELRGVGRLDGRGAAGQPGARGVERRLAGLRAGQHDDRRRDALPQASASAGHELRLHRARDHARRGQLPGRSRPARARPAARRRSRAPRSRGARPAPTSTASRSTSSAPARRARSSTAARPPPVRISRADIALTDNARADDLRRALERDVRLGRPGQRRAEHRRHLQGRRRRRGGDRHPGRRADGQRDAGAQRRLPHALPAAGRRAR